MKSAYTAITKDTIPNHSDYEGYLWYSDADKPQIIGEEKPFHQDQLSDLPFVIEGHLYSDDSKVSIQIKHYNGEYQIAQIDLNKVGDLETDEKIYIGHDIQASGKANYKLLEAWQLVQDDRFLAGMTTLEPAWSAFIGFTDQQNTIRRSSN